MTDKRAMLTVLFMFVLSLIVEPQVAGVSEVNASEGNDISIIPQPASITPHEGVFILNSTTVVTTSPGAESVGRYLIEAVETDTGLNMTFASAKRTRGGIALQLDTALDHCGSEGYELDVSPERIVLKAQMPAGLFYGVLTLRQLILSSKSTLAPEQQVSSAIQPCARVVDKPRFEWRGLMLDCSRTFWSKDYIRRYIDLLAFHKMNKLHLHLTDDQGWRVEIKAFPRLTDVGSKFDPRYEGETNGYYSQEDIRELVCYAASRFVTIVPEIDLPGHFTAGLAAYPELSYTGRKDLWIYPYDKRPESIAPLTEDILCAGNEKVFDFLEIVLEELMNLFPTQYIHIGGDEAPKTRWEVCEKCQARIQAEGLKDEHELQSYMTQRMADYLGRRRRKLVGWDEIMEGGLAENAVVMYWRGWIKGPDVEAARTGREVVMSPTTHCYFDYSYDTISTELVYSFEPVSSELTAEQSEKILGVQANMWTHIARSEADVDRQIFPRLSALAEVAWTENSSRDWNDFKDRMQLHRLRLDKLGVPYFVDPVLWDE